jgi:potassium-dependent mechanosensitive channel
MIEQPVIERFFEQFDVVMLVLNRPAVQRQVLVFALLILAAELVSLQLTDLRRRFFATQAEAQRKQTGDPQADGVPRQRSPASRSLRRMLLALEHTFSPIVAILLGYLSVVALEEGGWQTGLLRQGLIFFWILLSYRIIVTTIYTWRSERTARFYHLRILMPLFILMLIFVTTRLLSGIFDLAGVRLFILTETEVTLGALFVAIVLLYSFLAVSWIVQGVLNQYILPRFAADPGISHSVSTVSSYIIIGAGILAALGSLGLDLTTLAIIGAGLSVGIGFGLQDLVANFISGILLLFEQSIRPGDILEVEGKMGTVQKLRIRSTTVRTFDNIEVIIPNQRLLTSSVTTYTHTDRRIRAHIMVGASYDDEPQEVRDALFSAANRHGLVLKEPPPLVFFEGFGESSINFELIIWLDDIATRRQVTSDLHFMIWREFEKRGLSIPYPQQDLHLRSGVPWQELTPLVQRQDVNSIPESGNGQGELQKEEAVEESKESRLRDENSK